ncbi:unnamed protein product, partial [Sphacelaria rigidula]
MSSLATTSTDAASSAAGTVTVAPGEDIDITEVTDQGHSTGSSSVSNGGVGGCAGAPLPSTTTGNDRSVSATPAVAASASSSVVAGDLKTAVVVNSTGNKKKKRNRKKKGGSAASSGGAVDDEDGGEGTDAAVNSSSVNGATQEAG